MLTKEQTASYVQPDLNQQDLDRDFRLSSAAIFKWMQAGRMSLPWVGPGYAKLSTEDPPLNRRLVVRAQMVLMDPGALDAAATHDVVTHCDLGVIGKSSIELKYRVNYGSQQMGTAVVNMVNVGGVPGALKSSPVPERVRSLAAAEESSDRQLMMSILKDMPKDGPADSFVYKTKIRYTDEDINKHANHASYARFFDDAKWSLALDNTSHKLSAVASRPLVGMVIEYAKEARANDEIDVMISSRDGGSLDVHLYRTNTDAPGLLVRGHILLESAKSRL
jgi:acyl-CoA thioesterase FadM